MFILFCVFSAVSVVVERCPVTAADWLNSERKEAGEERLHPWERLASRDFSAIQQSCECYCPAWQFDISKTVCDVTTWDLSK